jgi:hypothetical protein
MEPFPPKEEQLVIGRRYIFSGKPHVNRKWFALYKSMCGTFEGYYHNEPGFCMQRFRNVMSWHTFEGTDLYNPAVIKNHIPSDYSRVSVHNCIFNCSSASRWNKRTTHELVRRSILYDRRQAERGLTGIISLGSKTLLLPRELIRCIAEFIPRE